jgi:hypothetical protein
MQKMSIGGPLSERHCHSQSNGTGRISIQWNSTNCPLLVSFQLNPSPRLCSGLFGLLLLILLLVLLLERRQLEHLANAAFDGFPVQEVRLPSPGQDSDPRLNVVVHLEDHILDLCNLARRRGDLVLWSLISELNLSPVLSI